MVPIRELLNRIRWDEEFSQGFFEIAYCDRLESRIIRAPFQEIHFEKGNRFSFQLKTSEGEAQSIPFHRVREVYKDGSRIWHRACGKGA